jgi:hypothetical protein
MAHRTVSKAEFDLSFQHENGDYVGGPSGLQDEAASTLQAGPGTVRCRIDSLPLSPASYHISASVYNGDDQTVYDHRDRLCTFKVVDDVSARQGGLLRIPAKWETVNEPAVSMTESPTSTGEMEAKVGAEEALSSTRS